MLKKLLVLALLFAAINAPTTYRATRGAFGPWVSSPGGCPTSSGVLLHAAVFLLAAWLLKSRLHRGRRLSESFNDGDGVLRGALYNRFGMRRNQIRSLKTVTWTRGTAMTAEARGAFFGVPEDLRAWVSETKKTAAPIEVVQLAYFKDSHDAAETRNPLAGFTYAYARFESQTPGLRGDALWYKPTVCPNNGTVGCTEGTMRVALIYGEPLILKSSVPRQW
jgi:hypothetical protein